MDISKLHNGLIDAGFIGNPFTWSNNRSGLERVLQRLDRIMVNTTFHNFFPALRVQHLERVASDHAPLCVGLEQTIPSGHIRFIFHRMWVDHPTFYDVVRQAWNAPSSGSASYIFQQKLNNVRRVLKTTFAVRTMGGGDAERKGSDCMGERR